MAKQQQTERQKINTILRQNGYEWRKSGGDPLHDVYEDLGSRSTWQLICTHKFDMITRQPTSGERAVTVREALEELVNAGRIHRSWLDSTEV